MNGKREPWIGTRLAVSFVGSKPNLLGGAMSFLGFLREEIRARQRISEVCFCKQKQRNDLYKNKGNDL